MNSSELSSNVTDAILTFHYVTGSVFFLINICVCLLIVFDKDSRGHSYRKYLISLQLSSTLMDLFGNAYAPVFLVNCRLIFSESLLSRYVDIAVYGSTEIILFGCVVTSYFACVYYRRNIVLPPGSRFCFIGWRRVLLFISLLTSSLAIAVVCIVSTNITRGRSIPPILNWVLAKSSFIFYYDSEWLFATAAVTVAYYLSLSILCAVMVVQSLYALNHGLHYASVATKRYQKRAVVSLAFQGIVPKIMFLAPVIVLITLYLNALSKDLGEAASNLNVSTISSLVFSLITTHALVHSMTIVACSAGHRRTIRNLIRFPFRRGRLIDVNTRKKSVTINHSTVLYK